MVVGGVAIHAIFYVHISHYYNKKTMVEVFLIHSMDKKTKQGFHISIIKKNIKNFNKLYFKQAVNIIISLKAHNFKYKKGIQV